MRLTQAATVQISSSKLSDKSIFFIGQDLKRVETGATRTSINLTGLPLFNKEFVPISHNLFRGLRWVSLIGLRLLLSVGIGVLCACVSPGQKPVAEGQGRLKVNMVDFQRDSGQAVVSLFASPAGFPDDVDRSLVTHELPIGEGHASTIFPGLPYGRYALSVLHDENGDGQMESSWLGQPQEGFGFSGRPDHKLGRPEFKDVSFLLVAPLREVTVRMRYETGRRRHQEINRQNTLKRPEIQE
jgi:uncharacterized protein (DUF2141 family)